MIVYYRETFFTDNYGEFKLSDWHQCDHKDFEKYMHWLPKTVASVFLYIPPQNNFSVLAQRWHWSRFKGWKYIYKKK